MGGGVSLLFAELDNGRVSWWWFFGNLESCDEAVCGPGIRRGNIQGGQLMAAGSLITIKLLPNVT